jgi:hypothetical protein
MKYSNIGRIAAVIALSVVIAILFRFFYHSSFTKKPIASASQYIAQDKSGEILLALFPHGDWADVEALDSFDRSEIIRVISEAKPKANKERATGMSFLLAALGHEYNLNRDVLYSELIRCGDKEYPDDSQCRYLMAGYLMELGRRGDASVFPALFDVADKADGAFAQSLGGFYSDMLAEKTEDFLMSLSPRPKKEQWEVCHNAGLEDGSGMGAERLNVVRRSLNELIRHQSLSFVVRRCLSGVETANKTAAKNDRTHE